MLFNRTNSPELVGKTAVVRDLAAPTSFASYCSASSSDFVAAYRPGHLADRQATERFKPWAYEDLAARDGFSLDIWADVEDRSATDAVTLDPPDVIAAEIIDEIQQGLALFAEVAAELAAEQPVLEAAADTDDGIQALLAYE